MKVDVKLGLLFLLLVTLTGWLGVINTVAAVVISSPGQHSNSV